MSQYTSIRPLELYSHFYFWICAIQACLSAYKGKHMQEFVFEHYIIQEIVFVCFKSSSHLEMKGGNREKLV